MNIYKLIYQVRNWKAHWRAFYLGSYHAIEGALARAIGGADRLLMFGTLNATVIRGNGEVLELGCIGKRVVTTAGVNYLRDDFNAATGGADIGNFNYHACGTGTTAEAIGDTVMETDSGVTRVVGTQSAPAAKTYRSVATMAFTSTLAITEHGIFSASTSGTLWDRTVFAAINVVSGDSIQFQYDLVISDGG